MVARSGRRLMRSSLWASANLCGVWLVTYPGGVDRGVGDPALAHLAAGAANEEGLPDAGEQEIVVERGGGPDFALFEQRPCAVGSLPLMGLPVTVWAKSGGRFASSWNHSRMSLSRVFWLSLATKTCSGRVVLAQVGGDRGLCQPGHRRWSVLPARSPSWSSNGIATPISLVRLSEPSSPVSTVFFGPRCDGRAMAAGPEDMDLTDWSASSTARGSWSVPSMASDASS